MNNIDPEILNIMTGLKSITYIGIGMFLTAVGIGFTLVGTIKQGKENEKFQEEISTSSKKNTELAEKLAEQTQLSSDKLARQNEESTQKIVQLSDKNAELTLKLTQISEERFRKLTIPSLNVLRIEEDLSLGDNSYFKIIARNTGNNDCLDCKLLVDRHNSPFAKPGFLTIQNFKKVPKDAIVEYKIPLFQSDLIVNVANDEQKREYSDFLKRYNNDESAIVVFFHFEYEWNNETLKSSQYSIVKSKNRKAYGSSSEDYVESEIEMPKWNNKK